MIMHVKNNFYSITKTYANEEILYGAVIGSSAYKEHYLNGNIDKWVKEIQLLSETAKVKTSIYIA